MSKTNDFILDALKVSTEDCIKWPFAVNGNGYPHYARKGRWITVSRLICEIAHGPCPPELRDAAHNCGNRKCVNPKHLRWATRSDNCMDRVQHGTANRGKKHGKVKLTEDQVRQLRRMYAAKENLSAWARQNGFNIHTVIQAARGRTWRWLKDH